MEMPIVQPDRDPEDGLDRILRPELQWQAPPELTARLLALVPGSPLAFAQPVAKPWARALFIAITALILGLSLAFALPLYQNLATGLGLSDLLSQLQAAPALFTRWLFETVPASNFVIAAATVLQEQVQWIVLGLILWAVLDSRNPARVSQRT